MNDNTFFIAKQEIATQIIDDHHAVIVNPDTNREKYLNTTGLFIWEHLTGTFSVPEIGACLASSFEDAPIEDIAKDIASFLDGLKEEGFIFSSEHRIAGPQRAFAFPSVKDAPKSVDISLTGKCNLRCLYCFYNDAMQNRPDLSAEEWLSFFDELGRLGVRDVCLSGGEVFVRSDLFELIDGVTNNRMRYSILTNGTLINRKIIGRFEKNKRRARLNSIQVSIDGSCPEVHDRSRGKGAFEKAIHGLRLLKEAAFPVTVRVTVNRHNVDDLQNIAGLLLDEIGLPSFSTNDAMPMGAGCNNQESITLWPHQQVQAMRTLADLAKRYKGRITATAGPLAKWKSYREMEHARATGELSTNWKMGYLTACGCVFNKLAVHHDGVVTPCNMLPGLSMGRVGETPIRQIWQTHPTLKALKNRRRIPMSQVPGCEKCEWAPFCNGSCPGLAQEMTGDFNLANPHDCYRRFLKETGCSEFCQNHKDAAHFDE